MFIWRGLPPQRIADVLRWLAERGARREEDDGASTVRTVRTPRSSDPVPHVRLEPPSAT